MTLYELKRYGLNLENYKVGRGPAITEKEDGPYVKYEDVRLLLVNLAGKIADQLIGI